MRVGLRRSPARLEISPNGADGRAVRQVWTRIGKECSAHGDKDMMNAECAAGVRTSMTRLSNPRGRRREGRLDQVSWRSHAENGVVRSDIRLDVGNCTGDVPVENISKHPPMAHRRRVLAGNESHHAKLYVFSRVAPCTTTQNHA